MCTWPVNEQTKHISFSQESYKEVWTIFLETSIVETTYVDESRKFILPVQNIIKIALTMSSVIFLCQGELYSPQRA